MNEMASQEPHVINHDTPVGKQIMGILELISGLEKLSEELSIRTTTYCLPLEPVEGIEKEKPRMSTLEGTLYDAKHRLERAATRIEMTMRGLQV